MKRTWLLFLAAICLLGMVGCEELQQEAVSRTQLSEAEENAGHHAAQATTPTAAAMASPAAAETETQTQTPALPEGLAVISDGNVCGGYMDGKWLTHSEAAQYLGVSITFHSYNLLGEVDIVESQGVSYSDDEYFSSRTKDNPDSVSGLYSLEIDDDWGGNADSYTGQPLEYCCLYNLGPECLPDITMVSDTSEAQAVIQSLLDEHFGKDAPEAAVIIAVSADIDADGKMEMVVNAANDEENVYEYYADKPLYCISCIIEDDGEAAVIDEHYLTPEEAISAYNDTTTENENDSYEKSYNIAFESDIAFFYVQNIIDLNNDGMCEFVLNWEAWEVWETKVYEYVGNTVTQVLNYGEEI